MIRKNIYKWHRTCSLIIAIPVLLWAISGFMHPIMTNFRPAMRSQAIQSDTVNPSHIKLSLQQALSINKIDSIYSARLVHIDTNWFYQVQPSRNYNPWYISAKNGQALPKGDWLYAQYLARIFLEGAPKQKSRVADAETTAEMQAGMSHIDDCCGEATSAVLNSKTGAAIESAELVKSFNQEYKPIYCLLPVHKVQFKRNDNIRLYVETMQDRFAVAVDDNRANFSKFFDLVHTWGWLEFLGTGRLVVEMVFTGLAFITSLMGLYIFFTTKSKKVEGNKLVKSRRRHRVTSIVAVLFTMMFTFSGFYHAFSKIGEQEKKVVAVQQSFAAADLNLDLTMLRAAVKKPIVNIGVAKVEGKTFWQVYLKSSKKASPKKDLMKQMGAAPQVVVYVAAADYSVLKNGDEVYARALAAQLSGQPATAIKSAKLVTKFTDEYNFTDKRLPVWKVDYATNHSERLYIETSTGILAKRTNNVELAEGYSFALFHKHHYMDFGGKTTRDASTMVGAALQILMVAVGLFLYFRWRKRKQQATA